MPLVKPTTTGRGKYFTMCAHAGHAEKHEQNAGHHGAHEQAVDPVLGDDSATTTTNAPVGPPTCVFEPPRAEI